MSAFSSVVAIYGTHAQGRARRRFFDARSGIPPTPPCPANWGTSCWRSSRHVRPLRRVHAGDAITLKTRTGDFEYLVESTAVVPPTDLQVLRPTGGRTLTLITCYPFSYLGPAPDRFIVRAREAEKPR